MCAEKWVQNPFGYLELIGPQGEILARGKRRQPPRRQRSARPPGRPSKLELARISSKSTEPRKRLYDPASVVEKVCSAVVEGAGLKLLGPEQGCPPQAVISKLRRENPDFEREVQTAIECRNFILENMFEERLMQVIRIFERQPSVRTARLAVEAYWLLAERNDPSRYRLKRGRGRPKKTQMTRLLAALGLPSVAIKR